MVALSLALVATLLPLARATTFTVAVGNNALTFDPSTVTAAQGDIVNFVFYPKAHSVTQSSFASPCSPLSGGFDSGLQPVTTDIYGSSNSPTFQVTVNDSSTPVWVYCKQQGPPAHCQSGMVFAINPPSSGNTFDAFQAAAKGAAASSNSSSSTSTSVYITPPAPTPTTVTATVTEGTTTITTTYASYPGTPPPTPAAQPMNHTIMVGANGFTFTQSNISASIGDTVVFQFDGNHTATQSSFSAPCQPLADTSPSHAVGFDSGFMPTPNATFSITINDTAPIWGFCRQVGHCGLGMVFSINAVESGPNNFSAFQSLAEHINGTASAASGGSGSGSGSAPAPSGSSTGSSNGALPALSGSSGALVGLVLAAASAFAVSML